MRTRSILLIGTVATGLAVAPSSCGRADDSSSRDEQRRDPAHVESEAVPPLPPRAAMVEKRLMTMEQYQQLVETASHDVQPAAAVDAMCVAAAAWGDLPVSSNSELEARAFKLHLATSVVAKLGNSALDEIALRMETASGVQRSSMIHALELIGGIGAAQVARRAVRPGLPDGDVRALTRLALSLGDPDRSALLQDTLSAARGQVRDEVLRALAATPDAPPR